MEAVTNALAATSIADQQSDGLVSHITLGDSNSERSRGWPHGIANSLLGVYGDDSMYTSGLISENERLSTSSTGYRVGYSTANSGTDIRGYHPTAVNVHPMPDALRDAWDSDLDTAVTKNHIHPKWMTLADRYITFTNKSGTFQFGETIEDESANTGTFQYMSGDRLYYIVGTGTLQNTEALTGAASSATCDATSTPTTITPNTYASGAEPIIVVKSDANKVGWPSTGGDNVAYRKWVAVFGSTDYPVGNPSKFWFYRAYIATVQQKFWAATAQTSFKDSDHGLTGTQFMVDPIQFDYAADYAGAGTIHLEFREAGTTSNQPYPRATFWAEYINTDMTNGWGLHQLYDVSGADSGDAETYLTDMGDSRISTWLGSVGHRANELGQEPKAVVWLLFGTNDATHGRTKAQYKASTKETMARMRAAWALAGWKVSNLAFVIMPSPPVDSPATGNEATMELYREAAREIALEESDATAINLAEITDATELAAAGMPRWDTGGTDKVHLDENASDTDNSYSILSARAQTEMAAKALSEGASNLYLIRSMLHQMTKAVTGTMTKS